MGGRSRWEGGWAGGRVGGGREGGLGGGRVGGGRAGGREGGLGPQWICSCFAMALHHSLVVCIFQNVADRWDLAEGGLLLHLGQIGRRFIC